MSDIGIIQPARLGDIIILIPAVRYLYLNGNNISWPILDQYVGMFSKSVKYVNFYPVKNNINTCVTESRNILSNLKIKSIFDIACTFRGSMSTHEYINLGSGMREEKFDAFKYRKLGVPLSEKWNLIDCIQRDYNSENNLYSELVKNDKYGVLSLRHSGGFVKYDIGDDYFIETNDKHSVFDWIKILENSKKIVMVDSGMSQLVEQLNVKCEKILISKGHPLPTFKNAWKII